MKVEPEPIEIEPIQEKLRRECKPTKREQQMNKPFFDSDYEKYDWLLKHGCTYAEERNWIEDYRKSDEYINLYED